MKHSKHVVCHRKQLLFSIDWIEQTTEAFVLFKIKILDTQVAFSELFQAISRYLLPNYVQQICSHFQTACSYDDVTKSMLTKSLELYIYIDEVG